MKKITFIIFALVLVLVLSPTINSIRADDVDPSRKKKPQATAAPKLQMQSKTPIIQVGKLQAEGIPPFQLITVTVGMLQATGKFGTELGLAPTYAIVQGFLQGKTYNVGALKAEGIPPFQVITVNVGTLQAEGQGPYVIKAIEPKITSNN